MYSGGEKLFYIQLDNSSIDNQIIGSYHGVYHVSSETLTIEILEYSVKILAQNYHRQQILIISI